MACRSFHGTAGNIPQRVHYRTGHKVCLFVAFCMKQSCSDAEKHPMLEETKGLGNLLLKLLGVASKAQLQKRRYLLPDGTTSIALRSPGVVVLAVRLALHMLNTDCGRSSR